MTRSMPAAARASSTNSIIGRPRTGNSTLGRSDFIRVPWPAARTTAIGGFIKCSDSFRGQIALGIECGHAAGAGAGDRLAIVVVGHVPSGEYSRNAGVRSEQSRVLDIALIVELDLPLEEVCVRRVADRQEQATGVQILGSARLIVSH